VFTTAHVHYRVQPSTAACPRLPDSSPRQGDPISLNSILILSFHLCLSLQSGLLTLTFLSKPCVHFCYTHTCNTPRLYQHNVIQLAIQILT
jgi:hypothetical protein